MALYFVLKIGLLGAVTYGSVRTAGAAWDLGDVGVGIMAWLNIIAILIIQKPALIALKGLRGAEEGRQGPRLRPRKAWHHERRILGRARLNPVRPPGRMRSIWPPPLAGGDFVWNHGGGRAS